MCSEVFTDPVTLACGHTFCRACAVRWFTNPAKRCPVARCAASAKSKPATLPAAYALKGVVESLRVYCRFGVREDERGAWVADPAGCPAQLTRADVAAHEAACEHALEACPFAGCGVQRRRRDADAHDTEMAVAHARGERDARLALEASARSERDARLALEASVRALQAGMQARLDAPEARLAAVVPAAAGGSGAARAVAGAVHRGTLDGHTDCVYACDWSPDGTMLVSGGDDGMLKLWNVATLECAATLSHDGPIYDCAWSPDGRTVAAASEDGTLKLWDMETRTCVATLVHDNPVHECAWSPDGRSLASTSTSCFKVWDVATRSCTATLDGSYASSSWSPDGRKVLLGGVDGAVTLWDVATRSCAATLGGHMGAVLGCAWCPDGGNFVTASDDTTLKVWSAAAPFSCTATLRGHRGYLQSCVWSPDGLTIASASHDMTVRLWDAATGNCFTTLECDSMVWNCRWSPDSNVLAVGCEGDEEQGLLQVFDVQRA